VPSYRVQDTKCKIIEVRHAEMIAAGKDPKAVANAAANAIKMTLPAEVSLSEGNILIDYDAKGRPRTLFKTDRFTIEIIETGMEFMFDV
jgi:hypothetical protein